ESAIPICAKDISDDLMKEFAFLSGGRGKDKAWIITLPDNAGFNEVPEEIVSKVLTYLTSVP
ncbi:Guanine nucleotide exchange factor DBS, partial [Colius striatus]